MRALPGREARARLAAYPAGVTRATATADQRRRILRAIGELVAEHGYAEVTIEMIVRRAHVSFKTFYAHFSNKRRCFEALFDTTVRQTESILRARLAAERRPWPEQVALALRILVERIAAEPISARAVIVEAPAAGPGLIERHQRATGALAPILRAGRDLDRRLAGPPESFEDMVSGAVFWIAHDRLIRGEADRLPDLLPELVELVLRTYADRPLTAAPSALQSEPYRPNHHHRANGAPGTSTHAGPTTDRDWPRPPSVHEWAVTAPAPGHPPQAPAPASAEGWLGELGPLPGGRHGLTREQIMESQRERLLAAASQLVATRGYHATTITDVVALASVSSKDFYAHFTGTEDCLLAAFAAMREYLQSHLAATAAAEPHWPRQVISVLAAALQFFAAEPDLASLCLIAPLSATPRTAERFREAIGTCPAALAVGREHLPGGECLPASTEDFLIGGVVHLATRWVLAGQAERLPVLLPDLVEFVLGPYLGVERAANLAADAAHI